MPDPTSTPDAPALAGDREAVLRAQILDLLYEHCRPGDGPGVYGQEEAADAIMVVLRAERDEAQPVAERVGVPKRLKFDVVVSPIGDTGDADLPGYLIDEETGEHVAMVFEDYRDGFDYEAFGKALADAYNAAPPAAAVERAPPDDAGGGADPNCPDCLGEGRNIVSFDPPASYPCACTFTEGEMKEMAGRRALDGEKP